MPVTVSEWPRIRYSISFFLRSNTCIIWRIDPLASTHPEQSPPEIDGDSRYIQALSPKYEACVWRGLIWYGTCTFLYVPITLHSTYSIWNSAGIMQNYTLNHLGVGECFQQQQNQLHMLQVNILSYNVASGYEMCVCKCKWNIWEKHVWQAKYNLQGEQIQNVFWNALLIYEIRTRRCMWMLCHDDVCECYTTSQYTIQV